MTVLMGVPTTDSDQVAYSGRVHITYASKEAVAVGTADTWNIHITSLEYQTGVEVIPALYGNEGVLLWQGASTPVSVGDNAISMPPVSVVSGTNPYSIAWTFSKTILIGIDSTKSSGKGYYSGYVYGDPLADPFSAASYLAGIATAWLAGPSITAPDYTARKGSTFTVTHGLGTAPDSVTINALACTIANATTTTVDVTVDAAITTSGEYDIVIEDTVAVTSETQTVQVNVVGLPSFNINKDGADQASLADVEFIALSGTAGSRAVADQVSGITTDVNGDTGPIEFTDLALSVGDTVFVVQYSPTVSGGHPGSATLEAI